MARFGRLVGLVAERHHAKVDNVFDLARVLRAPGSVNHKSDPVPVTARRDTGGSLTVAEIEERLTELGICHDDDITGSEPLSDPGGWKFAWQQSCPYVAGWLERIPIDGPLPGGGRNPWVCSQAVRLHCAWRLGCITEDDFRRAKDLLRQRLTELLMSTAPRRQLRKFEMRDAFKLVEGIPRREAWVAWLDGPVPREPSGVLRIEDLAPSPERPPATRGGRWTRLHRAGAEIRAPHDPRGLPLFDFAQPLGLKPKPDHRGKPYLAPFDSNEDGESPQRRGGPLARLAAFAKRHNIPTEPPAQPDVLGGFAGNDEEPETTQQLIDDDWGK